MFSSFFDEFPELVHSEFRNVTILDNGSTRHIPPGNYAFCESFCTDPKCDCRNAFIHVISDTTNKPWAVLRYGWESKNFYKKWFGGSNELEELRGSWPKNTASLFIILILPLKKIAALQSIMLVYSV